MNVRNKCSMAVRPKKEELLLLTDLCYSKWDKNHTHIVLLLLKCDLFYQICLKQIFCQSANFSKKLSFGYLTTTLWCIVSIYIKEVLGLKTTKTLLQSALCCSTPLRFNLWSVVVTATAFFFFLQRQALCQTDTCGPLMAFPQSLFSKGTLEIQKLLSNIILFFLIIYFVLISGKLGITMCQL